MEEQTNAAGTPAKDNRLTKGLMAVVAVGLVGGAVAWGLSGQDEAEQLAQEPDERTNPPNVMPDGDGAGKPTPDRDQPVVAPSTGTAGGSLVKEPVAQSAYRDGTYSAVGVYTSPAQQEDVGLTLTLKDGWVVDVELELDSPNKISQRLQGMFADGYEAEVVGLSVDDIDLDVVNGSSLTPKGFMDALEQIKTAARS